MTIEPRRLGIPHLVAGLLLAVSQAVAAEQSQSTPGTPASSKTTPKPAAATAAQKMKNTASPQTTESILVRAKRTSTSATSATKSDTPIVDTAQSVTVITRNEMDVRGVLNLNQAVRYAAGITQDQRGSTATRYDMFALRGFTVPIFLDGLKLQSSPSGYATAQTDMSRLDRIEILKGPSSALYGQSSPGGLVAMSSKMPADQKSYGSLNATGGSFDLYRVDGDVGGWGTDNGFVRYRINATANGSHSQLTKTASQRFSISPSISFGGDGPTTFTLLGNYQYDPENASYGSVPLRGSLTRASFGHIARDFYDGDTSFEKFNRKQGAITYIFNHQFNKDWSFSTRGRYDDIHTRYASVYGTGIYADPTTGLYSAEQEALGNMSRGAITANEHMQNLAFDSQFKGKFRTAFVRHTFMAGFDYQQSRATEYATYGSAPDINVFHPDYNQTIGPLYPYFNALTDQQQIGAYGQDEIRVGNLFLTGSIRNDWYNSTQTQYIGGTSRTHENPSQLTFRASGLYHFDFGLSPYISYSTSFQPQSGIVSNNGGQTTRQADPSLGKQLEGGVKYQIPGTPVLLTAAGFHIEQTNVLVAAGNLGYSTESGLVHSDGFEFEAHVEAYKNLMITAAYSTQRTHDDSTGKPLVQAGRGNASLFAFYTLPSGRLKGFGFGGGLRHAASSFGGSASYGDINVPSYTVFDGSIRYDLSNVSTSLKGWTLSASVRNLFDKRYVASCYGYAPYDEWCWYGERRNAQGTIGFRW